MQILTAGTIVVGALAGLVVTGQQLSVKAESVEVCKLSADPQAFNHRLVDVSGLVSHGFERFQISDAKCSTSNIWLEYGGAVNSETVYCCGTAAGAPRSRTLVVEGFTLPLADNALFRRLDERIREGGSETITFRATLRGRFFAGARQKPSGEGLGGGYGHLGCCSLLVIQQVLAVD